MAQFALAWEAHRQNICQGLSVLQQNGEFVDMTIAADGHHVKVHQMIMSLASPYIKDLILTAQCPHPVIFLNKVSYPALCGILEYIYTGEAVMDKDNLAELVEAGRELHIKGLEDMRIELVDSTSMSPTHNNEDQLISEEDLSETPSMQQSKNNMSVKSKAVNQSNTTLNDDSDNYFNSDNHMYMSDDNNDATEITSIQQAKTTAQQGKTRQSIKDSKTITDEKEITLDTAKKYYTISNMGTVQMIFNRNIFFPRYKYKSRNGLCRWKCAAWKDRDSCAAALVTKDDVIVKRFKAHSHPFQDEKILRKVREGAVFATMREAQAYAANKRAENAKLVSQKGRRK